jgi:hypothetical protein
MGQEFVQGRIEQADADRQPLHDLEQSMKVGAAASAKAAPAPQPGPRGVGKDHLAHQGQAVILEEHVLGPAQADPLRRKSRAMRASAGVSALARMPMSRAHRPNPEAW